ncbi:MAG: DUF5337 family protein [Rhodobacteraceae bacterium]|nr:DUF5337 family protein [Paracoccaceae bacterium]
MPLQARVAGVVIVVAMVAWMGASVLGGAMGLPPRFAFLFDFAALAAFFWALVVLFQVWRARQPHGDS